MCKIHLLNFHARQFTELISDTALNVRLEELSKNLGVPSVRSCWSDQSVLKWNARVLRTGSGQNGPTHGSEPLSSTAPVGKSAGIWRVVVGKCTCASSNFVQLDNKEMNLL